MESRRPSFESPIPSSAEEEEEEEEYEMPSTSGKGKKIPKGKGKGKGKRISISGKPLMKPNKKSPHGKELEGMLLFHCVCLIVYLFKLV